MLSKTAVTLLGALAAVQGSAEAPAQGKSVTPSVGGTESLVAVMPVMSEAVSGSGTQHDTKQQEMADDESVGSDQHESEPGSSSGPLDTGAPLQEEVEQSSQTADKSESEDAVLPDSSLAGSSGPHGSESGSREADLDKAAGDSVGPMERAHWCGKGDSDLPCDVLAQLEMHAVGTVAKINSTDPKDRQDRKKLGDYFKFREENKKKYDHLDECCRKCKLDNQIHTPQQDSYWEDRAKKSYEQWAEAMKLFLKDEKTESPDLLWNFASKHFPNGPPPFDASKFASTVKAQVAAEGSCANNLAKPLPAPAADATEQEGFALRLPEDHCYLVEAKAALSAGPEGIAANATIKAQTYCAAAYYVKVRVESKVMFKYVQDEARLIQDEGGSTEPITVDAKHKALVAPTSRCGCNQDAPAVSHKQLQEIGSSPENVKQAIKLAVDTTVRLGGDSPSVIPLYGGSHGTLSSGSDHGSSSSDGGHDTSLSDGSLGSPFEESPERGQQPEPLDRSSLGSESPLTGGSESESPLTGGPGSGGPLKGGSVEEGDLPICEDGEEES